MQAAEVDKATAVQAALAAAAKAAEAAKETAVQAALSEVAEKAAAQTTTAVEAALAKAKEAAEAERVAAVQAALAETRAEAEKVAAADAAARTAAEEAAAKVASDAAAKAAAERAAETAARAAATEQAAAATAAAEAGEAGEAAEAAAAAAVAAAAVSPMAADGTEAIGEAIAVTDGGDAHGRDPRLAPPWITENAPLLAELAANSSSAPKAATASKSAKIISLLTLADLERALEVAEASGKLVVVKYYAPWCKACLRIKPLYERAAEGPLGERVDFYEVDGGAARVLVALADVKKMPATHVYARGAPGAEAGKLVLAQTRLINSKPRFEEFSAGLVQLVLKTAQF